jgi:hypothetical protein
MNRLPLPRRQFIERRQGSLNSFLLFDAFRGRRCAVGGLR